MAHKLTVQELEKFAENFNKNPQNQVVARAAQKSGVLTAAYNDRVQSELTRVFSTELDTENVTNQRQSGRCWEFATLNILRHNFGKKYHCKNFTFPQSYNFFWDKIERANIFMTIFWLLPMSRLIHAPLKLIQTVPVKMVVNSTWELL